MYCNVLPDKDRILLSRIYKLDRQIETYMKNHEDMSMNKLLPKTDWDKNGNFTAGGLSWIHKDWIREKFENDEYLRPQKNKH